MYARQPPEGRFPRNVRVPRNYSGNAFSREEENELPPDETPKDPSPPPSETVSLSDAPSTESNPTETTAPAGKLFPSPGFRLDLGRFFNRDRGFGLGFEELLLIGLILLISQSDTKDDLIFLLILLLFIQ